MSSGFTHSKTPICATILKPLRKVQIDSNNEIVWKCVYYYSMALRYLLFIGQRSSKFMNTLYSSSLPSSRQNGPRARRLSSSVGWKRRRITKNHENSKVWGLFKNCLKTWLKVAGRAPFLGRRLAKCDLIPQIQSFLGLNSWPDSVLFRTLWLSS